MRGPGGGGGVSTRGAGGGVGAMIVVETVLPADGSSLVIVVFFSTVTDDWAKAGAVNSRTAPAATSRRLILTPSISRTRFDAGASVPINRMKGRIIPALGAQRFSGALLTRGGAARSASSRCWSRQPARRPFRPPAP